MIRTTSRTRPNNANNDQQQQQQLVVYNSHSPFKTEKEEWDFIRHANVRDTYKVLPIIIGTGSFGTVRSCIHRTTRTKLAIKSLNIRTNSGNTNTELLKNEISLLQKLHHNHIVKVVDVLLDRGYVHIIMEHYTGKDLFDVIVGGTRPVSEGAGRYIISQLLHAVMYLHERCIVHRDLKVREILYFFVLMSVLNGE
jgi:serine/threonine protein kinase